MLSVLNFKVNSLFEEFFLKKLLGILLKSCQDIVSTHSQVFLTPKSTRLFAFAITEFTDFKFIRKMLSNKSCMHLGLTISDYTGLDNVIPFKEQGNLEHFLKEWPDKLERDWVDPVRYQPTFSRMRSIINKENNYKGFNIEKTVGFAYNVLEVFAEAKDSPWSNGKALLKGNRKNMHNIIYKEFISKKLYRLSSSCRKKRVKLIDLFRKDFAVNQKTLNYLKGASKAVYGRYFYEPENLLGASFFVKTQDQVKYFCYNKQKKVKSKIKVLFGKNGYLFNTKVTDYLRNKKFSFLGISSYITKVLSDIYIYWVLTQKATKVVNVEEYENVYRLIFTTIEKLVHNKIMYTLYVQDIQSTLLNFIYKKEFNSIIINSLVNKKLCYRYIHLLLVSLLLVDLSIIVKFIANRIHKTKKTKRLQKRMLNLFKRIFGEFKKHRTLRFIGFYFQVKGKLKGKRRKSRWLFKLGSFPLTQDTLDYNYSYSQAVSRFGAYGVRCQLITKKYAL